MPAFLKYAIMFDSPNAGDKNSPAGDPVNSRPTFKSIDDISQEIKIIKETLAKIQKQSTSVTSRPPLVQEVYDFFSSGIFYMLFGSALLYFSYHTLSHVHASFSFVLIVLSVAILLYGTGTQSVGEISDSNLAGKYNVMIAGGAGALALLIGLGMVTYGSKMPDVFGIERKRMVVVFNPTPGDIGKSLSTTYFAEFLDEEGRPLPYSIEGNAFRVLVPYFEKQLNNKRTIVIKYILHLRPDSNSSGYRNYVPGDAEIQIDEQHIVNDSSFDLPTYNQCGSDKDCKVTTLVLASLLSTESTNAGGNNLLPDIGQKITDVPAALKGGGEAQ